MKKRVWMMGMMLGCIMLAGCQKTDTTAAQGNVQDAAAVEADSNGEESASADTGETAQAVEESAEETTQSAETFEEGFVFPYKGMDISMNQDMSEVLEVLGEPNSYFEAASCAFEGLDKMYTYSSFEIDSYPDGEIERVSAIYFKDDLVTTAEGICLYMTKADMEAAYGTEYEVMDASCTYTKGDSTLTFILNDNDEIVSIEYQTSVDYN